MNEIFSRFDEDLYEQKFKMSGFIQNEQESVYNLNLLAVHKVEATQKLDNLDRARDVNAFLR